MSIPKEYVEGMLRVFPGRPPFTYKFLRDAGLSMTCPPHELSGTMKMGQCFRNALETSIAHGFLYVEGVAATDDLQFPMMHAWCYDPITGQALDPTWSKPGTYFGAVFEPREVAELVVRAGYYGLFENLHRFAQLGYCVEDAIGSALWRPSGVPKLAPWEKVAKAIKEHHLNMEKMARV